MIVEYLHTSQGGHVAYVSSLAESLSRSERVLLIGPVNLGTPLTGVDTVRVISSPQVQSRGILRILNRAFTYFRQPSELRAALSRIEMDLAELRTCHFQELPSIMPSRALRIARYCGFLTALTVHNVSPHALSSPTAYLKEQSRRRAWRRADLLIVHSETLVEPLRRQLKRQTPAIEVIPHPVWSFGEKEAPKRGGYSFLFFGNLRTNKGIDLFVRALALLGDPPATIAGAGTRDEVSTVTKLLAEHELVHCRFVPGYVPQAAVRDLFLDHDVLVAPYRTFGAQSGVTHLALSYNTPIVVTAVGALADVVTKYGVGEIAAGVDAESLADSMQTAERRAADGEYAQGLALAREQLSQDRVARMHVEAFKQLRSEASRAS